MATLGAEAVAGEREATTTPESRVSLGDQAVVVAVVVAVAPWALAEIMGGLRLGLH